jgi:hypothetical protein
MMRHDLSITGTLANSGAVQLGSGFVNLSAATTLTQGGLTNVSGASFAVTGSSGHHATLTIGSFTSNAGSFGLTNVAPLTLTGPFTNTGTFGLGGATTLTINGDYTNSVGGILDIDTNSGDGGADLSITGTLANSGAVQLGSGFVNLSAATTLTLGGLTNVSGASFAVIGSSSHAATLILNGLATNSGILTIGPFAVLDMTSTGTLEAKGGSKIDISAGSLANLSGTTLTGGAYKADAGSIIQLPNNATVATLAASLTLNGIGSVVESLNTTTNKQVAIENTLTTIAAGGSLNVLGGRSYTTANTLSVAGVLQIDGGGKIDLSAGNLHNLSGTTLTGGTYVVGAGSTLQMQNNTTIVTLAADLTLSGAGSIVESLNTNTCTQAPLEQTLTTIGATGAFRVLGGRGYSTANAITDDGVLQLDGGTFAAASLTVDAGGTLTGFGSVAEAIANSGTVDAAGGELILAGGYSGSGSYKIEAGATLDLTGGGALPTTITGAGALQLDGGTFTGSPAQLTNVGSLVVDAGAELDLTGSGALPATVTDAGTLQLDGGIYTAGSVSVGSGAKLSVDGNSSLNLGSPPLSVAGTLINAGTISGGGTAVAFSSGTDRLILYPGAKFTGTVAGGGANSTIELAKGSVAGTLNALGTTFINFGTVVVDTGATWTVDALASALAGVALTGTNTASTLDLISAGTFSLGGVSDFSQVYLAAGNNTVTVTDNTLSGGSVTFRDGASGNNKIDATGDTVASKDKTLIWLAGSGTDTLAGGYEIDKVYVAAGTVVAGDTFTGGSNSANALVLTTPGNANLGGVSKFSQVYLAAGNTVTVTEKTLSGGPVTFHDGASGNNSIDATGVASQGKTLIWLAGSGKDTLTGGSEIDKVYVTAAAVGGDTFTGGGNTANALVLTAGSANLGGVSKFSQVYLAAAGSTVTVTDKTLSGGPVTFRDAASGNNKIDATGDTVASKAKTLIWLAGSGTDTLTGGSEIDKVYVTAAAVGGDTFTGGGNAANALVLTAGSANLGGVSKFSQVYLAAAGNTVTVTNNTLSGGPVTFRDAASGNNSIDATGVASQGKTLIWLAGSGKDTLTGGSELDKVYVTAAAVGGDTFTGGSNAANALVLTAGSASLGGVSKFSQVYLAAGNTVTVTNNTLSGGSVTFHDGASGNNSIDATSATASQGKTLIWLAGSRKDTLTGGSELDKVYVTAAAVGGDTFTGGGNAANALVLTAGSANLGGVSKFSQVYLAAGNTVTVTDTTLSGGSVTFRDGVSGNNSIDATGAVASQGKTLIWLAGSGKDTFTGGSENDVIYAGTGKDTIYAGIGVGTYTAGSGSDLFVYQTASDSPFVPNSGGALDDTIIGTSNGFLAGTEQIDLTALLLSNKSVLDKGVVSSFSDTTIPGYFGTSGVAVEYKAGNTAHAYIDANNDGSLDSGDMMIKFTKVAPGSLDLGFLT